MPRRTTRTDAPPPPLAGVPVLSGTLSIESGRAGEPQLLIVVKCPACRASHSHTWAPTATGAFHRAAHCRDGSPLRESGYCVECPDSPHNRAVLREFARRRQQWLAGPRRRPHLLADLTGAPVAEVVEVVHR